MTVFAQRSLGMLVTALLCLATLQPIASAETFPTRPVRLIVPTAAGSSPDVAARRVADLLSKRWKQQVLVDNRPGAATSLGAQAAAGAAPDGYTLFFAPFNTLVVNPYLYDSIPYDAVKSFVPVSTVATASFVLAVHPSVPVRTLAELVEHGKKHPGTLKFGTGGPGTPQHIFAELLSHKTGLTATHIPYKSAPPALADLLGGHLDFMFEAIVTTQEFAKSGRLKLLAVTSRERVPELPDVPTLAESRISDEDWTLWSGIVAPAGTPPERVEVVSAAIREVLETPGVADAFPGARLKGSTPEAFGQFIASERPKWKRLVELSGARLTQ